MILSKLNLPNKNLLLFQSNLKKDFFDILFLQQKIRFIIIFIIFLKQFQT